MAKYFVIQDNLGTNIQWQVNIFVEWTNYSKDFIGVKL